MDLTETFAPNQGGDGTTTIEKTTDYFDFVVSPPPHCANTDVTIDEESFLHRTDCRTTIGYLDDTHIQDGIIKETNNNTLTALPPVSTITGSLGHISHHHNHHRNSRNHGCHLTENDTLTIDQTAQDCDYWVTEDSKEQTCNILLEDLNKYCWTTQTSSSDNHSGLLIHRRDSTLGDNLQVHPSDCTSDDRQNTDGAIYTLTVLKSEPNSMDDLECCKSPTTNTSSDGWTLRPNHLDLDAILNMESSVNIGGSADGTTTDNATVTADHDPDRQVVVTANGTTVDRYAAVMTSQYASDEQSAFGVTVKTEPGDNNNDWKLSDRNSLQDTVTVTESAAESLLRNALQGKLYSGAITSTTLTGVTSARMLAETQIGTQQDETMHSCSDDLLLSQLDVDTNYRTTDYEKLKNIANEVVESYCNLEPVCNVSATTVMYTLDPTSGSLGTITLPADLAQVGTVTVVTTAPPQQDVVHQDSRHTEAQPQSVNTQRQSGSGNQLQLSNNTSSNRITGTKSPKKYVRRMNRNSTNITANVTGAANSSPGSNSTSQVTSGTGGTGNSPASVQQRKERSLHYCSICSKGFKDKYSVNVHIRTHTGEKPFACSLCGKSFRQKAHLAKHYQTHVTQKPSITAAAQTSVVTINNSNTNKNNNSSNGAISTTNSNSGSTMDAPSPTTTDVQVTSVQHQQTPTTDSTIVGTTSNSTS